MAKISLKPNNDYCPQTLFLYGTYDEKGNPDFVAEGTSAEAQAAFIMADAWKKRI